MHDVSERLREQNHLAGWLDCEAVGRVHHWNRLAAQHVGTNPVAEYISCRRCPVSTRRTVRA